MKTLKDFKKGSSNRIKFAFLKDHFGWSIKKTGPRERIPKTAKPVNSLRINNLDKRLI